ncbi:MAG: KamA family radical SAM protein [Bacteroidetes bacterium]|nr:MAG: KamA family radical SAM protein [Bacteroidota bacterium]
MEKKAPVKKTGSAVKPGKQVLHTRIIDDVFTDAVDAVKPRFQVNIDAYLDRLWEASPNIYEILKNSNDLEEAREKIYDYLQKAERRIFDVDNDLHILEKSTVREAIRVMKSIIGPVNEYRTKFSALDLLMKLTNKEKQKIEENISPGFILEFINLFRGLEGRSNIYFESKQAKKGIPDFLQMTGRAASEARTNILNELSSNMQKYLRKYPSGLEEEVIHWRKANKKRILKYFNADEKDWDNYQWHLKNVIKDAAPLIELIELTEEQKEAITRAIKNKIPFGITPYYLSLMDSKLNIGYDHAVRAQVIPPPDYVDMLIESKENRGIQFDFMGEHDTSPVDLVTRRYPGIAIVKPYNTCSQICVYCQRNWEIDEVMDPKAMARKDEVASALQWLDENPAVGDVLITGGDPCVMNTHTLKDILERITSKKQVYRIRLGSRTPVVLPQRWNKEFVDMIASFQIPGKRQISIITHFEHNYEITPEAMEAVQRIRKAGMMVYNQEVFTVENSRRFESVKLRLDLKSIGVDPYYTFNMKGKEETKKYMVPIARILQERKEEARLLPGLDRTDEPVFNVPKLGKNQLMAWQDHRLVMILPNGGRVYEFHPWEKNIQPVPPYNYIDVPIYDYLEELAARGENIRDYRNIWFYY